MHEFVSFNHQISPANQVKINGISAATFYGNGIFTTIAVYHSKPFLWEKHWQRLTKNAVQLGIDISDFSEESVKNALSEIIDYNKMTTGRARLTLFDESSTEIWQTENVEKTSLLIVTADRRIISNSLRLTVSPFRVNSNSPLVNIKSCNYLENFLALREAKQRDFNEAVRLNEKNEIVSACLANIFWIKDDEVFTPTLETGALQGTTRDFILDNFPVIEKSANLRELQSAAGIFLTSAGVGIAQVETCDGQRCVFSNIFHQIEQLFIKIGNISK